MRYGVLLLALAACQSAQSETRREAEARAQARVEIEELEARKASGGVRVLSSRYSRGRDGIGFPTATATLRLRNDTDRAVAAVLLRGALVTPGRSVPWVDGDIWTFVPGGLEPGEEAEHDAYLDRWKGWANQEIPQGVVLTTEVVEALDANDQPIPNARGFTASDEARLDSLRRLYP